MFNIVKFRSLISEQQDMNDLKLKIKKEKETKLMFEEFENKWVKCTNTENLVLLLKLCGKLVNLELNLILKDWYTDKNKTQNNINEKRRQYEELLRQAQAKKIIDLKQR